MPYVMFTFRPKTTKIKQRVFQLFTRKLLSGFKTKSLMLQFNNQYTSVSRKLNLKRFVVLNCSGLIEQQIRWFHSATQFKQFFEGYKLPWAKSRNVINVYMQITIVRHSAFQRMSNIVCETKIFPAHAEVYIQLTYLNLVKPCLYTS